VEAVRCCCRRRPSPIPLPKSQISAPLFSLFIEILHSFYLSGTLLTMTWFFFAFPPLITKLLRASVVSCGDEYTHFHIGIGLLRINSNSNLTDGDGDADGV
jgi:hypothetical protein